MTTRSTAVRAGAIAMTALCVHQMLGAPIARAGLGEINANGEASLTYTYVTPPASPLTAAEITNLSTALVEASRHVCQATDGLVKVNHWTVDPAARLSHADVLAYPRVAGRAGASYGGFNGSGAATPSRRVTLFNDFDSADLIAHELGHYLLELPDEYNEQSRRGDPIGSGGAFFEGNAAFDTPRTNVDNTMMESQSFLTGAGLELQLSHDAVFDLARGDDNANQSIDEDYPVATPTSQITIGTLRLGTAGTAQALDTSSLERALATAAASSMIPLIDEGGSSHFASTGEDRSSAAYQWGDRCDFGRATIRAWVFLEWTGGSNYRLVVAAEDRQFDGTTGEGCPQTAFNAITLRRLGTYTVTSGVQGCGDGVVTGSLGEECEPSLSATEPCSRIPGGFTSTTATTTCNPATCTWRRAGCYAGDPSTCGALNTFNQQCYNGIGGGLTVDACVVGTGSEVCTDCLDDPGPCSHPVGTPSAVINNGGAFNVPNTSFSITNQLAGAQFTVRLNVTDAFVGATSGMFNVTADGVGDCAIAAQNYGYCTTTAECEHVCGEIYSTPGAAFHMTEGNASYNFGSGGRARDVRCQNVDASGAAPANCSTPGSSSLVMSEWDMLQYNLRSFGLNANLTRLGERLGQVGDALRWGQSAPAVEGAAQDCGSFNVEVDVLPAFDPTTPGRYDTALVVDTSGSMSTPAAADGTRTRADLATAAGVATMQMLSTAQTSSAGAATYSTAITSFADVPVNVAAARSLDAAGLAALTTSLQGRPAPSGSTAVGEGVRSGYGQLDATQARDRFVIVVSDGYHNTGDPPADVTRQLMASDNRLHVCPVYFGEGKDQSEELAEVAREGRCSLRIADPNTNDITTTMFEGAAERAGGSVLMSDRVIVSGESPRLLSSILSLLNPSLSAQTELIVSPEMKNIRLLVSDSGRNKVPWVVPTVTLTAPNGTKFVLDASRAKFNEIARGYRMFELPITGAAQPGRWTLSATPPANASNMPIVSNLSIVADKSDAQCSVRVSKTALAAGRAIDISVAPIHAAPLNLDTVSTSVAVFGPSQDGTVRRFSVPLIKNKSSGEFEGRFTAPAHNGVYSVQALCEATNPVSTIVEGGPFNAPVAISRLPAFRVQGANQFIVYGGAFVCRSTTDCDSDGVLDANEPAGDADGDGVPNRNDADADDDGMLDGAERGRDLDRDGVPDGIDADMDNDGRPDYLKTPCAWTTLGGGSTRAATSTCAGSTQNLPAFTYQQRGGMKDGPVLDRDGVAYVHATTSFFLEQSVIAVNPNGSVKWRTPIPMLASTAVEVIEAADLVAIGNANGNVMAYNSRGELAWSHFTSFPVQGLVARGGRVYVSTWLGGLYALDAYTGNRVWSLSSLLVPWGVPALSPDGSTLYATYGVDLVAVDTSNGTVKWDKRFPMTLLSSMTVGPNGDIYMGGLDRALYRFNTSGVQVWRYAIPGAVLNRPAVDGTNIYFGSDNNIVYALRDGATAPTLVWSRPIGDDVVGGPSKAGNGLVYVGSKAGLVYGLNATSGAVTWQKSTTGAVGSTIAIGDKRVVFTGASGKLSAY